ncbi:hypothetical protein GQ53DRAFT_740887 [Thozetella sp. PMI_491]|nr:hypothetical protein GQ53DRAFT_740887 [Thozetella sp. PMI_491]
MGNSNTRESRSGDSGQRTNRAGLAPGYDATGGSSFASDRPASRRNRVSRADLGGILGLGGSGGSGSQPQPPYERRETRQEREARRLERDRVARIKERERSLREEHVDGGYLVTLGTYTGPEDFNKQIVRQLQIERKMAPFWRGLNDVDANWTEPQIIAAARGLPIPAADETPPEELIPRPLSAESPAASTQNLNNLMVPIGGRTLSAASDQSASNAGSALPSPITSQPARTSSPFKPRGKALAAVLGTSSRNASTTEIAPREINLPNDPFVNGQPLEVFLYKAATECPICFLSYPPYLNHTRCCDQEICSECFVQIKRPDPHFPEGHNENDPNNNPEEQAGMLVSEPACCPYCTQPDFGVTYEPPPFRRGLAYAFSPPPLGAAGTAMSSSSSLNSASLSPLGSPTSAARRRAHSLSANAPNVIATDKIRPEWSTKLQSARAHQARRAAAATALHTAAFLMTNSESARSFRVSRFGRRNTGGSSTPTAAAPATASPGADVGNGGSGEGTPSQSAEPAGAGGTSSRSMLVTGPRTSGRSRMEDLEEMMFMEAIRLSLAEEENRKRKEEKEERKQAKKREKEERKAQKAAAKHGGPYDASGQSSASGSTLSLPGFGRKRGNSAASNLRVEASVASAVANSGTSSPVAEPGSKDKGKNVDRGLPSTPEDVETAEGGSPEPETTAVSSSVPAASAPRPIPSVTPGPSHLRQMSSASSVSSSLPDSQAGSYQSPHLLQDPRASGLSLGSRSAASDDGDHDPSSSTEPMFNFRSLAEVVGVTLEGENAGRRLSRIEAEKNAKERGEETDGTKADEGVAGEVERVEDVAEERGESQKSNQATPSEAAVTPLSLEIDQLTPPKVTITPETPAPIDDRIEGESKQLGYTTTTLESARHVTQ